MNQFLALMMVSGLLSNSYAEAQNLKLIVSQSQRLARQSAFLKTLVKAQLDSNDFWERHEGHRCPYPTCEHTQAKSKEVLALLELSRLVASAETFSEVVSGDHLEQSASQLLVILIGVNQDFSQSLTMIREINKNNTEQELVFELLTEQLEAIGTTLGDIQRTLLEIETRDHFVLAERVRCKFWIMGNDHYAQRLRFSFKPGQQLTGETYTQMSIWAKDDPSQPLVKLAEQFGPQYKGPEFGGLQPEHWSFPNLRFNPRGDSPLTEITILLRTNFGRVGFIKVPCKY